MKHNWERNEDGTINEWSWESGFHNGVYCEACGQTYCVHCKPDYDKTECTANISKEDNHAQEKEDRRNRET